MLVELTRAVEARHPWTRGHANRVAQLTAAVARTLRWPDERLAVLSIGSLLHDVGKLSLPTELLGKPGPLTATELEEVRAHPAAGARFVASLPQARRALPAVLYHHERWDGGGYPSGLESSAIPAEARLIALADAFDAMTSHRPYRDALPLEAALEELARCAGTQFDPELAPACAEIWAVQVRVAV